MEKIYFDKAESKEIEKISKISFDINELAFRPKKVLEISNERGNLILAKLSHKKTVGWIERYYLGRDWWGISSLYVLPKYRRKGFGRKLIKKALFELDDCFILTSTKNKGLQKFLTRLNFEERPYLSAPFIVLVKLAFSRYYHPKTWLKLAGKTYIGLVTYIRKPQYV